MVKAKTSIRTSLAINQFPTIHLRGIYNAQYLRQEDISEFYLFSTPDAPFSALKSFKKINI